MALIAAGIYFARPRQKAGCFLVRPIHTLRAAVKVFQDIYAAAAVFFQFTATACFSRRHRHRPCPRGK
jgi:hypothetical protein